MKTKQLNGVNEYTPGGWESTLQDSSATTVPQTTTFESAVSHLPIGAKVAAASSLLLGVGLRDWLTNQESAFLDLLAPENHQVFLIREGRFLYPKGAPLFPLDVINPSSELAGEAIFSHRYELTSDIGRKVYRARTTSIKLERGSSLIFGLFSPEDAAFNDDIDDRFSSLVYMFRKASKSARKTCKILQKKIDNSRAQLIVNRASGCVVHANREAGSMLANELHDLVGSEYSHTASKIGDLSTQHKISLENFKVDDINLSLVTLTPLNRDTTSATPAETDTNSVRFKDSLSAIVTAASVIESSFDSLNAREIKDMANVILDEAYDVNRQLSIENQLKKYAKRTQYRVNLQYEVEKAIDSITSANRFTGEIKLHVSSEFPYATAPCDVYVNLFESVLSVHSRAAGNASKTLVSISSDDVDRKLSVIISTRSSGAIHRSFLNNGLQQDIERLAKKLDVGLQYELDDQSSRIVTSIIIPLQETLAR
ncbi:MAG: hypothetical protein U9N55_06925 [candidate division Zixibacteria bacterium]|nr:hypothetical protein [candidate division Zixibacteria bacterium]